jgi:thioredoxin reductase (NADPH)
MFDIIIIGGGPAGISAAITAKMRNKNTVVISKDIKDSNLYKAAKIDNYPGVPSVSGAELAERMKKQAEDLGVEIMSGRVQNVVPIGKTVSVGVGDEIISAACLIIATGIVQGEIFPGEKEFLGRGVSYCATCDGMFYRGKKVCVINRADDADEEIEFLKSIDCEVIEFNGKDVVINGDKTVHSVTVSGEEIKCHGVFIFRKSIAPDSLLPGLELEGGHIKTSRDMETNISGVYAAGDCTGKPYQISKAAGEGQVAALAAVQYMSNKGE